MEESSARTCDLPPGFRFHPTDEELIVYYFGNKALNSSFPCTTIADVDLYKLEPWDLPAARKAKMGEQERSFFSCRDRKYPTTAVRANRATASEYCEAAGKDKENICSNGDMRRCSPCRCSV